MCQMDINGVVFGKYVLDDILLKEIDLILIWIKAVKRYTYFC